jgi:hypothetical protein
MSIRDFPPIEIGSFLAASHRFMNLISPDCELRIRAPSNRKSLFSVCDPISPVISTACAWCMIIPCMNATSAADCCGNVPRVDGGSTLLAVPGAPGCTTTGPFPASPCPPRTPPSNAPASAHAATNLTVPHPKE